MEGIREAVGSDVPRIVELGRRFLAEGPYKDQLKDNPDQAVKFAETFFGNPQARILVSESDGTVTGLLAFLVSPHYLSGEMTATEFCWYVEPEHRSGGIAMKLMWEAERLAGEMGATKMGFTAPDEKASAIYVRFGYHAVEVCYQKELRCQ